MRVPAEQLATDYLVLSVELGERAYGLATLSDRVSLHGVYVAPTAAFWGFTKPADHAVDPGSGRSCWELEHFLRLALTGDPVATECLWSPIATEHDDIGAGLRHLRPYLVSRRAYRSHMSHMNTKVDRLRGPVADTDWEAVADTLRLLISLGHLLRTGEPLLRVDAYRDRLIDVAAGAYDWDEVRAWRDRLSIAAQDALTASKLPDLPDYELADRFLVETRRRMV